MDTVTVTLHFGRDTGRYLVGDLSGREYWFDKGKLTAWSTDQRSLVVTLDEAAWEKRVRAERPEPAVVIHKTRKCLCCRQEFGAERFMFVCSTCKETANWREGVTVFSP